jgi:hypothetical protein
MDSKTLVQIAGIIFSIIIALIGWVVAHKFTSKRDLANKKREIKINFLINVYNNLAENVQKKIINENLEKAISDIQFLGDEKLILLAKEAATNFAKDKQVNLDNLIRALRDSLRDELEINKTDESFIWLRVNNR